MNSFAADLMPYGFWPMYVILYATLPLTFILYAVCWCSNIVAWLCCLFKYEEDTAEFLQKLTSRPLLLSFTFFIVSALTGMAVGVVWQSWLQAVIWAVVKCHS